METPAESIICRVCGDQLGSEIALACKACGTPHHKDCWDFTGSCSVYGCGCTRTAPYLRESLRLELAGQVAEVVAIDEDTPIPAAYVRRRDGFPSPSFFAVMAYNHSVTGVKLFGTGMVIWLVSFALSRIIEPVLFFAVAGHVLMFLAPIYWIAATVLSIISISTGLVDGRVERKAIYGFLVGSFIPILVCLYIDLGTIVVGGAAMLFAASFVFQLVRNAINEKLGR